jgi:hypothetical protein
MKQFLIGFLGIQSIRGYSMHDLNNNENTWEIAGEQMKLRRMLNVIDQEQGHLNGTRSFLRIRKIG